MAVLGTGEIVGGLADSFDNVEVDKKLVGGLVDSVENVVVGLAVCCVVISFIVWVKEEVVVIFIGVCVAKDLVGG